MESGLVLPLTRELDGNGVVPHPSSKVDYYLNNLLASHLSSNSDLTPEELAEASRSTADAAAIAAKAARAIANEKAIVAAKAIAAAKKALELIASFPNPPVFDNSKSEELPSNMQLVEVNQSKVPNSSPSCEHVNDQRIVPIGSGEMPNSENVISERANGFNGLGMELVSADQNGSAGGESAKEGIQVTRKRGRPKSKTPNDRSLV